MLYNEEVKELDLQALNTKIGGDIAEDGRWAYDVGVQYGSGKAKKTGLNLLATGLIMQNGTTPESARHRFTKANQEAVEIIERSRATKGV